ncbi:rhodanese-like domain-containing protein [Streptococcus himalayensis]|uniref:NADH dehydrogenase n=1 Tax=Streptococcus himalayensis TaxID=1888195 RepID=A0A917A887_9STRE|nr:rhodanese-like domain-containing protein [Streptococcus himalayensis]GGE34092.1 NADH dehydrogenase [Streptococcus himalayensis]
MMWIFWLILLGIAGWMTLNYFRVRKAAQIVGNETFASLIRTGQLVDVRDAAEFQAKHILGARNIPSSQLKLSMSALRKDRPVLLYENSRGQRVMNAALALKKAGYQEIYILSYGLDSWDGKVKKG